MARTKKTPSTVEEIARSDNMRQMLGERAIVVFHSPDQGTVSPGVYNFWKPPVVDLLVEAGSHFTTGDVHLVCARFIGWCFARSGLDTYVLSVLSVPTPPGGFDPEDQEARYAGIMAKIAACDPPPVLVNVDLHEITRAGQVLWQVGIDAVRRLMEIFLSSEPAEKYKEYEERINRAENPRRELYSILRETRQECDSEPSDADARPTAPKAPRTRPSARKKGKAKKRPPRP